MDHLIETVRKYPCLWNTTAIEYRDQELKDAAWAEVMKETDLSSVKEVKLKWKKLRDSYRDALKRQSEVLAREPSGHGKKNYPWKYMGHMHFLQPFMSNRKKPSEAPRARNGLAPRSSSSSESEEERGGKRRCAAPPAAPAPPADPAAAPAAPAAAPDPLDMFFKGMCQSTKRLPFHTQLKIKRSLFEAVTAAEEALLAEQHSYAAAAGLWARAQPVSSDASSEPDDKPC